MKSQLRKFKSLATSFIDERNRMFPHEASELGHTRFDAELGANGAAFHSDYTDLLASTLRDVEALPDSDFAGDDWIDRRALLAMLRTEHQDHGPLARWRTNPQVHCDTAIQAIFGLVVRHATNLGPALPAIVSRLEKLPQFLREGAAVVREPVPLWTSLARQTCAGADSFLAGVAVPLAEAAADSKRFEDAIRKARAAFANYSRSIARKSPGPAGGFSIGRERFEMLIRERLGLDCSLPEAEAIGRDLVASLSSDLKKEAAKFGRRPVREILSDAAAGWKPQAASLVAEYERVTTEVRARFDRANLLTLPERERLDVKLVPDFLKHQFPTAAYQQPGPFARKQDGIFWVNDLSLDERSPARRAAEIAQHYGLELTCAHEGYPGHHVQFVIQNRHPSHLRRHFAHAIYYEGWTLWCERMCIEHGIWDSPYARLVQLNDALWRACRIVIDCGLHSGGLSYRQACGLLVEGVGFTAKRAQGDVNWYTSSPTVPMSYLLGRREVERLHRERVTLGGWTMRRFNDWMLSFGAVPWSWIRQAPGAEIDT